MENRALLAFVLSLGVFILWGFFLALIKEPPLETQQDAQEQAEKVQPPKTKSTPTPFLPESGESAPFSQEPAPAPKVTDPLQAPFEGFETIVNVDNGKLIYLISSKGGTLKEILVNKYKDNDGNPINLIKHPTGTKYPLTLVSNDEKINYVLQNAFYETSTSSLTLSEFNPKGTVTLTLKHPSGVEVIKELTFEYNKFLISVKTRVAAKPFAHKNLKYTTLWGPGLGGELVSKTDYFTFAGPTTFVNNERVETSPEDVKDTVTHKGDLVWTSFQNKYFAAALIPEQGIKSSVVKKEDEELYVGLNFESVESAGSASYLIYVGTKELEILEESGHKLVRLIDYGWFGNKFAFLVKPMLKALNFFYGIVGNYGWAIIILTFFIKLFFFPLTHKSFKSMKGMQKVQPYVKVIQERYKDDRQKMNQEMMELYKKHRVNPLGGCLPMLLQIPVFIAFYHALFFSIELRGAPFMLWIKDLSVADPYYVTPVIMGATMFLQQRMTPSIGDPMQQKILMFMPIIFTFLFITFPAGLVIYWTVNNVLTITQQYYIYKIAKD